MISSNKFLVKVDDKHQLVFPNDALVDLDLHPGDELEVSIRRSLRQDVMAKGLTEKTLRDTATMQSVDEYVALQFLSVKGAFEGTDFSKRVANIYSYYTR